VVNTGTSVASTLRAEITRRWHANGQPPTHVELARALDKGVADIERALRELVDLHGVVLDGAGRIRIAHPFQTLPSTCWVEADNRGWWCPCAWCALGSMAMSDEPARFVTTFGAEDERIEIRYDGSEIDRTDWVMLITRPAREWWNDVPCTCALNQLFRSPDDAVIWSARHGFDRGEVLSGQQAWSLSQQWYGGFLAPAWRRKTADEVREILGALGLTGPFWELPKSWH